MRFNVALMEPDDYPYGFFLYDYARLLVAGLESLGHSCILQQNALSVDRVNIILGAHLLWDREDVDTVAAAGPFVVVQTELVPGTLEVGSGASNPVYRAFLERAVAVWEPYESNLPRLAAIGVRDTGLLKVGYHPALRDVVDKREKDIDFLFFGSLTPHRSELLGQLEDRGHRVVATFDARRVFRNDLIARAKVNVCPTQGALQQQLPMGRIGTVLNNGGVCVVEQCRDQAWLESAFVSTSTEAWVATCEGLLHDPAFDRRRERLLAAWRALPITAQLEPIVGDLAAMLDTARAA